MYQIVSTLNGFIREEMMPNPFEFISDNPIIVLVFTSLIGSKILKNLAYSMCGIFYNKGDAPILGSILYMFFWGLNVYILIKVSQFFNNIYVVCIIYSIAIMLIYKILNNIKRNLYIV